MAVDPGKIRAVAARLRGASRVLWITGAGISADSGLPTYRGIGGLYDGVDTDEGIPIEDVLSASTFAARPELTWKYVCQIEAACRGAKPNAAHEIIAKSEQAFDAWTLTQNVDGFHRRAGANNVIDIHGDIYDIYCLDCSWQHRPTDFDELPRQGPNGAPSCPECGALIRPNAVLFGEMLSTEKVDTLHRELSQGFDAVISIGTTSVFPYIAQPVLRARVAKALTVEINPGRSEVSDLVEFQLASGAAETLTALWSALESS